MLLYLLVPTIPHRYCHNHLYLLFWYLLQHLSFLIENKCLGLKYAHFHHLYHAPNQTVYASWRIFALGFVSFLLRMRGLIIYLFGLLTLHVTNRFAARWGAFGKKIWHPNVENLLAFSWFLVELLGSSTVYCQYLIEEDVLSLLVCYIWRDYSLWYYL